MPDTQKSMLLISNMYPDDSHPSYGVFVKRFADQACALGWKTKLSVMHKADGKLTKILHYFSFYVRSFVKTLFEKKDIVYVHYPSHSAAPVLLARKIKRFPLYVNVHGTDVFPVSARQQRMHRYTELALRAANKVITPSEFFADVVKDKYKLDSTKVFVYPSGGIDFEVFHPLPREKIEQIKSRLKLDRSALTLCFAGRITEGKGWDTYLKAVKLVLDSGYSLNVLFVGNGDQENQCNALIGELGIFSQIVRMGLQAQEHLCELYNVSDVFVFSTKRSESLGLSAIEAMACGTPVIASRVGALKYYIDSGYNGYTVQADNPVELANIIRSIDVKGMEYRTIARRAEKTARQFGKDAAKTLLQRVLQAEDNV